jgi:hypothetical protein
MNQCRPLFAGEWATVVRREGLRTGVPLAPERIHLTYAKH